jgi:alkanesulfonate monooxygenase SsuD/methylene tetrahydromethanopterin reductase-like flavin-dependent oxidoreductase (luciferase family)
VRAVDFGVHLPLLPFGEPFSPARLNDTVDAARECGFAAVSANDHLVYQAPWLDGPAALASVIERSGDLELATTVALVVIRGAVASARTLAAIDTLSGGRLIAGVGPGSSPRDYDAVGIPFDERWPRFEAALVKLRDELSGVPIWVASWGSKAGLARVARHGDGWLASAYNTTPERFAGARASLPAGFPNALATMWTWVTGDRAQRDRVLSDVLAPLLNRDPEALELCIGSPEHCAQLLSRYAQAGCGRVYVWPLGDERRQLERFARDVMPLVA